MTDKRPGFISPLESGLVAVPSIQPGICPVCRTATKAPHTSCYKCDSYGYRPVLPISMSVHGGHLHHHLRGYKDGRSGEAAQFRIRLAALLSLFLEIHVGRGCVAEFDLIATVPSPTRDAPRMIVNYLHSYRDSPNPLGYIDHVDGRALAVVNHPGSARVLLFDDTFTSGGSLNAADTVLTQAGIEVVDRIVIGRHVRPEFAPSGPMIEQLTKHPFRIDACGRCGGVHFSPPLVGETPML